MSNFRFYFSLARLDHWTKNVFLLPGVYWAILDKNEFNARDLIFSVFAALLSSSANYTLNEWLDRFSDSHHPTKKYRSAVQENLKAKFVYLQYMCLAVTSCIFALTVKFEMLCIILAFLLMGLLYNVKPIRLKDIFILDVVSESFNNPIRFLVGWYSISDSFFSNFLFLVGYWGLGAFLMNNKRLSEILYLANKSEAFLYRPSFKYYTRKNTNYLSVVYILISINLLQLEKILNPSILVLIVSLIVMFLIRYYILSKVLWRKSQFIEPEKLIYDPIIQIVVILILLLFTWNYYI
jgi:4-hydroxybenzoate polyprenyltransferase